MKQRAASLICSIVLLSMLSCNQPVRKNEEAPNSFLTAVNGIQLDPRLSEADSLVFVFHKNPYGPDSLRYTRYYTQYSTTDSSNFSPLLHNLQQPFTKLEKVKNCRSEGKVWCYSKGAIFQTVYFSTRCNDCCFIYLIRDGFFFYMPLDTSLSAPLGELKLLSKEVKSE